MSNADKPRCFEESAILMTIFCKMIGLVGYFWSWNGDRLLIQIAKSEFKSQMRVNNSQLLALRCLDDLVYVSFY